MSKELNDIGLTPKQAKVYDEELANTQQPAEIESVVRKFAKIAEENAVLARADQIKAGRDEASDDDD